MHKPIRNLPPGANAEHTPGQPAAPRQAAGSTAMQADSIIDEPRGRSPQPGTLYVVATPIGNLDDISMRAKQVLAAVGTVYAEDTRHSQRLLAHLGVQRSLVSLHEHNEAARIDAAVARLRSGQDAAIISDAGTPLVSDPGFRLVDACYSAGIRVSPIPGACAAIAALSAAGQPCDRFLFCGFPPPRSQARRQYFVALERIAATLVLYESRHRIIACVDDLVAVFGGSRCITLAREITKQYETLVRLPAGKLLDWLQEDENRCRGEFVLVIAGNPAPESTHDLDQVLKVLLDDLSASKAAAAAARICGVRRQQAYQRAVALSGGAG